MSEPNDSAVADPGQTPTSTEPVAAEPSEQRSYSSAEVAAIVRDRVARQSKAHEAAVSKAAELAAAAAAERVRAQVDANWADMLVDAGINLDECRRWARLKRTMESATRNKRIGQMKYWSK
jgi:hypothetical protein